LVIDRLNSASAHRNPFLSSAFLLCYALRNEYYVPGREERLSDRVRANAAIYWGVRLEFLAPFDTSNPGILSAPEDEARVAAALTRYICDIEKGWGKFEFVSQRAKRRYVGRSTRPPTANFACVTA
jgi:hypothetical protein